DFMFPPSRSYSMDLRHTQNLRMPKTPACPKVPQCRQASPPPSVVVIGRGAIWRKTHRKCALAVELLENLAYQKCNHWDRSTCSTIGFLLNQPRTERDTPSRMLGKMTTPCATVAGRSPRVDRQDVRSRPASNLHH